MKRLFSSVAFCLKSTFIFAQATVSETEKIATFCKVWSFLKYYHPVVATGKIDWDKEFTTKMNSVRSFNTKQQINAFYSRWVNSLGEIKYCKSCNNNIPDSLKFNLDNSWLYHSTRFTNQVMNQLQYVLPR